MEELVADSLKQRRFNLFLLGLFAAIALLLATIGIYGSISYSTRQRTNEIGVRIALGARGDQVLWMVLRESVVMSVVGLAIGLPGAIGASRLLKSMLFGLTPNDPWSFAIAILVVGIVAVAAGLIPARRATSVDPVVALRTE